jgi:DNA-binding response OmpR family regulator
MSEMSRVLIVEDDIDVGCALELLFLSNGFTVERCSDGQRGLERMTRTPSVDAVVLDVLLPDRSGFDVLREVRRHGSDVPVIFLSVRGSAEDRLHGFGVGADDYLSKPFRPEELLARVSAVIRRARREERMRRVIRVGELVLDFERRSVKRDGTMLSVTPMEFNILRCLAVHRGRTVSRNQVLCEVWSATGSVTTRTIDRHVASLRRKLEADPRYPALIETVYGIGYKIRH